MSGSGDRRRATSCYPSSVADRMSRARTPFGAVPISTIYGYDYPLSNNLEVDTSTKHEKLSDCVDYMVRSSRAFSEQRVLDPYYVNPACTSLSFMPMALRDRSWTPMREPSPLPIRTLPSMRVETKKVDQLPPPSPRKTTTVSYSSTTPWNATGFYYSPRYPQSSRGTASTYNYAGRRYFDDFNYFNPYANYRYEYFRYPVRRFVPSYVPFRYSRRY